MKNYLFLLLAFCFSVDISAQIFPDQWEYLNSQHQVELGRKNETNLYSDTSVHTIHLEFYDSNYWQLMGQNFNSKTPIPAKLIYDGGDKVFDTVGVRFKGQTSYSQVNGDKKSFNIELDWATPGNDINGYNTMNLQNCYQDESFLREVLYMQLAGKTIPTAKTGFVHLYINNQDWGLYPHVQQLNKDYYEEWYTSNDGISWRCDKPSSGGPGGPGFGNGTAALNYLGPGTNQYQTYYTLKYDDMGSPWDTLNMVCNILENTPIANVESALSEVFDIDRAMWHLANEILFTDDDGYVFKGSMDYWAFYEKESGRLTIQDYDANTCMHLGKANSWSVFYRETNQNFPLMYVLWQVPSIRQRYLAHVRTILNNSFSTSTFNPLIDYYAGMIDTLVQSDPKKLYSYNAFLNEVNNLKLFMSNRLSYASSNSEVQQIAPVITSASHYVGGVQWDRPSHMQSVDVRTSVTSTNGINSVNLFYAEEITGKFTKAPMYDDGLHNDGSANDGTYGATIPGHTGGHWMRYYVEAVANNPTNSVSYMPEGAEHDVFLYLVEPVNASTTNVVVNEIMAKNVAAVQDPAGDYDDWIELYNTSSSPVDISGWTLTDNQFYLNKWAFPTATVIQPFSYLIVWADENGSQGGLHANFKLDGDGEEVLLLNTAGELVNHVSFGAQTDDKGYARIPNGTGNFIIKDQTHNLNNEWAVGLEDQELLSNMYVYPNPSRDRIFVKFEGNFNQKMPVELWDMTGKNIGTQVFSNSVQFETSHLANGLYLVQHDNRVQKIVVQH